MMLNGQKYGDYIFIMYLWAWSEIYWLYPVEDMKINIKYLFLLLLTRLHSTGYFSLMLLKVSSVDLLKYYVFNIITMGNDIQHFLSVDFEG